MPKLIEFELSSDFAFFKKPDINNFSLTYNIPPKPTIIGILGSLLGLNGIRSHYENKSTDEVYPEFYNKLLHFKIGITPLDLFPYNKIINTYNSTGFSKYTNVIINEQIIIKPVYKIYVYVDDDNDDLFKKLLSALQNRVTIYLPYLGKNEFILSINNVNEVQKFSDNVQDSRINVETIFCVAKHKFSRNKTQDIQETNSNRLSVSPLVEVMGLPNSKRDFIFQEHYPVGYVDGKLSYQLKLIKFTTFHVNRDDIDLNHGKLLSFDDKIIYVF